MALDDPQTRRAVQRLLVDLPEFLLGELREADPELIDAEDFTPADGAELEEWLAEHPNGLIVAGPWPPFLDPDPAVSVDALVPHPDGSLSFDGAY